MGMINNAVSFFLKLKKRWLATVLIVGGLILITIGASMDPLVIIENGPKSLRYPWEVIGIGIACLVFALLELLGILDWLTKGEIGKKWIGRKSGRETRDDEC